MFTYIKKSLSFGLSLIITSCFLGSCDDGDLIVTSFEFDEADLKLCSGIDENSFVFFKINTELNEAISYNFISPEYNETESTENPLTFTISENNNQLVYRQFNQSIEDDYYCNTIPDSDISVINEIRSLAGIAEINVEVVNQDDEDGIPAFDDDPEQTPFEVEDLNGDGNVENDDTDGDGIWNYIDQDDDNDNILTSAELSNGIADDDRYRDTDEDGIPDYRDEDDDNDGIKTIDEDVDGSGTAGNDDTDGDGIFNYRDDDDDGDGILTKNEVLNEGDNPRNYDADGDGIPEYLDTNSSDDVVPEALKDTLIGNIFKITYRSRLSVFNLEFEENQNSFEDDFFVFGFRDVVRDSINDFPGE